MQDLHIHTKYSDGEFDENQIVDLLIKNGVTDFAVCDHDTILGSQKVEQVVKQKNLNLTFHSGVELTCRVFDFLGGINVHLLVRDFDFDDKILLKFINEVSQMRYKKIQRMVDFVTKIYNVEIPQKDIDDALKNTQSFGKPHLYKILTNYGNFDREEYYIKMRNLNTEDLKLDAVQVISNLKNHKGYVTLAHPVEIMEEHNLTYDDMEKLIEYLAKKGLKGLETKHSKHTKNDAKIFSKMAKKYNLIETCGSDFHGPNIKPNVKLGIAEKIN